MLNKKLMTVAVSAALLSGIGATSAQAFDISANVALVSDYRFRGISQTGKDAAVQGGFDASWEPGFYLGTWASSVDFGSDNDTGSFGTMEIDYYAGWAGPIGDTDFGIDVGYMYYQYPGDTVDPEGDYQEFYLKGSWRDLSLGLAYSDDYYAESDEMLYVSGDYSLSFLEDFSLGLHAGYTSLEELKLRSDGTIKEGGFLSSDEDGYADYSVSLTYTFMDVDFGVAWVGTDLDDEDVFDTDYADDVAVFSISKSL
jgi:uncharacterized protein (TIGR02001 family)